MCSHSERGEKGDRDDYLRNDDVCAASNGSISKSNCPKPPSCKRTSSTLGKQKLCINRAFEPANKNSWYVVSMKCIPKWENCDKCFCGYMKESYAMTGYCKFDDSSVNDDRVDVDCDSIESIKMMGRKFSYKTQKSSESESSDTKESKSSSSDTKESKSSSSDTKESKSSTSDSKDSKSSKSESSSSSSSSDSKESKSSKSESSSSSSSDSKESESSKSSSSSSSSRKR